MPEEGSSRSERPGRVTLFVLFLLSGLLIHLLGGNYVPILPTNKSTLYKASLPVVFLVVTLLLYGKERWAQYWEVAFALFVGSSANLLNWWLGPWLAFLYLPGEPFQQLALDKVSQAIPIVLTIVLLTRILGFGTGSIYLQKGNLKRALVFGSISFAVFAGVSAMGLGQQAEASGMGVKRVISSIPWILAFVLANGFMEELWFRGLYLRKLEPLLGPMASLAVTSLLFGALHVGATYVSGIEALFFPALTALLGFVGGYAIQKTDSLWGAVLFHAGYDLVVIIPIAASLR